MIGVVPVRFNIQAPLSSLVFVCTNYSFWLAFFFFNQLSQQTVAGEHRMCGLFSDSDF